MSNFNKLSHTIWNCKYHIVFCPKFRYQVLTGKVEEHVRNEIYRLVGRKDQVKVIEINIQKDHIHLILEIPPKYAISDIMGFLKGKLSISLYYKFPRFGKTYWGRHFWSRGYCVSTIGLDEEKIKKYVAWQQEKDKKG